MKYLISSDITSMVENSDSCPYVKLFFLTHLAMSYERQDSVVGNQITDNVLVNVNRCFGCLLFEDTHRFALT